jgi:hypothetical protein
MKSIELTKILLRISGDTHGLVRTETRHTQSAILKDERGYSLDLVVLCRLRSFVFSILLFVVETPWEPIRCTSPKMELSLSKHPSKKG